MPPGGLRNVVACQRVRKWGEVEMQPLAMRAVSELPGGEIPMTREVGPERRDRPTGHAKEIFLIQQNQCHFRDTILGFSFSPISAD